MLPANKVSPANKWGFPKPDRLKSEIPTLSGPAPLYPESLRVGALVAFLGHPQGNLLPFPLPREKGSPPEGNQSPSKAAYRTRKDDPNV